MTGARTADGSGVRQGVGSAAEKRPRTPGVVYATFAVLFSGLVATIALTSRHAPPPTIAEFAPQAVEQITDAAAASAGVRGDASNRARADGDHTAVERAGGAAIDVARVRQCIGDPPRQIEDPQSPPCVPYWSGDNGGATSKGVTRDEIRIVRLGGEDPLLRRMERFFNTRFEFYGRKLRFIFVPRGANTAEGAHSDAVRVDAEHAPFASLAGGDERSVSPFIYYDELARRGIVSVHNTGNDIGLLVESHLARFHPYQWSYLASYDVMSRNKASWACNALKGREADFGGPEFQNRTRVFGILWSSKADDASRPPVEILEEELNRCGIEPAEKADITGPEASANAIVKMRSAGVTTIFAEYDVDGNPYDAASTAQAYYPEWLVGPMGQLDLEICAQACPRDQWEHAFGTSWWNKTLPGPNSPWYWALKEADPSWQPGAPQLDYMLAMWGYSPLLVIAAGIQMAGPRLTPETFAKGLQSTTFPNPGAGDAPYYQARIGFRRDHTAQDDAALIWSNRTEQSPWGGAPGTYCFASRGVRYAIGGRPWPTDYAGLFEGPCR